MISAYLSYELCLNAMAPAQRQAAGLSSPYQVLTSRALAEVSTQSISYSEKRKIARINQSNSQTRIQFLRTLVPQSIEVKLVFMQKTHSLESCYP